MKRYILPYISLLTLLLFAACTSDDVTGEKAEGEMTNVSMSICTRATGTAEPATDDVEKIHTWWVVFVNNAGKVQKIVERPSTLTSYVEEEKVDLDIPTGTYTLYAFANISRADVVTAGYTFTEGETYPSGIETATWSSLSNGYTNNIPMTGKQYVTVTGRVNETFSIEVVRMLAKMEFKYTNKSTTPISINSLSIKQVQNTSVSLLPNYTYLNSGWPFDDLSTDATTYIHTYSTPLSVAAYSGSGNPASTTDKFYMIESQADYKTPSQSYLMALNVTRNSKADILYFTLDNTKIQTIYRNDHIIVPLTLMDYIVSLDVNFYPPIGGYPAVISEDMDKEEFYCTFKTQGEFEITPTVYNASTGTNVYYPNWDYNSATITVSDPKGIFTTAPHIDSKTGEILGKLSTKQGTAVVDIAIKVKTSTSSDVWQVYPRRIYIIRSN